MSTTLHIDQRSYGLILSALATLPKNVTNRVVRVALNAWGGIVKQAEKSAITRKRTGALAKSPIVKVTIPDASLNPLHHGKPARAMVGPGRRAISFSTGAGRRLTNAKVRKHFEAGGNVRVNRPSRYAHLVMKGIAGRGHVAPDDFITPAANSPAAQAKFESKLSQGIYAEAARMAKA